MIRVALAGLLGRKLRTALTAFAVVLGVAMVSGTLVLTDSIDKAFNFIFTDVRKGSDAVVECLRSRSRVYLAPFPVGVRVTTAAGVAA